MPKARYIKVRSPHFESIRTDEPLIDFQNGWLVCYRCKTLLRRSSRRTLFEDIKVCKGHKCKVKRKRVRNG